MRINITSRIRNAIVGLTLGLSFLFIGAIFLLVYSIEDQVFINQISVEQAGFEKVVNNGDPKQIRSWQPSNANIQRIDSTHDLPSNLSKAVSASVLKHEGMHEYFDNNHALFIASLRQPVSGEPYYLIYDVKDLLVVRNAKQTIFILIGILTFIVAGIAVALARRLTNATLAPVFRLSRALKDNDLDHVVVDLANEFSEDEIGVLAKELAQALEQIRASAQREYEFNRGVSHELRSPIQVAQSATEVLQLFSIESDSKIAKTVSRLQRSVSEMNEIAEAFLWLASDRTIEESERSTEVTLESMLANIQSAHPSHEIVINTDISEPLCCPIPHTVLSVVLRNIVRNAVMHGDLAPINIDFFSERITVSNSINLEQEKGKGYGIGLSIVQRICDRFSCKLTTEIKGDNRYFSSIHFV